MRAAGRSAEYHPISLNILLHEFFDGERVTQRAGGPRITKKNKIGPVAVGFCFVESFLQNAVAVFAISDSDNLRAEQTIQQKIRGGAFGRLAGQHQNTFESKPGRRGRGLAAMIGLDRARADQRIGALVFCFRDEKLQFASFVAAEGESRLVVALDEDTRPAQRLRKTRQFFDWCWQMGKMKSREHFSSTKDTNFTKLKYKAFPFQFRMTAKINQNTNSHSGGFQVIQQLRFFLSTQPI